MLLFNDFFNKLSQGVTVEVFNGLRSELGIITKTGDTDKDKDILSRYCNYKIIYMDLDYMDYVDEDWIRVLVTKTDYYTARRFYKTNEIVDLLHGDVMYRDYTESDGYVTEIDIFYEDETTPYLALL